MREQTGGAGFQTRTGRRGFTLVELIVVLGIIALLLGLTVSASVAVLDKSRQSRTEASLRQLDRAVREWEMTAERKLTWWEKGDLTDPGRSDIHWNTPDVMIISEMLPIVERAPDTQLVLAHLDPRLVYTYQRGVYPPWIGEDPKLRDAVDDRFAGAITVLDAWGMPIYATHPGRAIQPGDDQPRDFDGTIRTRNEHIYGVARDRHVTFVSAGPDGDFGRMFAPEGERYRATMDNLYSAPVWGPYVVVDEPPAAGGYEHN